MTSPEIALATHPAPGKNGGMLVAPRQCSVSRLRDVDAQDWAAGLVSALGLLRHELGEMPDFNAIFMVGPLIDHAYMEIIPRGGKNLKINIDAGYEMASGDSIITVDPRLLAAALKRHLGKSHQSLDFDNAYKKSHSCRFCTQQTPTTLIVVGHDGSTVVPDESDSIATASNLVHAQDAHAVDAYYELVKALAVCNQRTRQATDAARVFLNLTPALVSNGSENCVVVALADPRYHGLEFPDLPLDIVSGYFSALQFLEAVAEERGVVIMPFINSGPSAGGTVACPHGQAYFVPDHPPLHRHIAARRESRRKCGVCEILAREDLSVG